MAHAQPQSQEALQMIPSGPATEKSTYLAARNRKGVFDADPNIYVLGAGFARRFQMPEEWVSAELIGVDAVAFRQVPSPYRSCGGGDDPKGCPRKEMHCEMDLYFGHTHNPLPWEERVRGTETSFSYTTSARFLASNANRLARPKSSLDPNQPRTPFTDPKTGQELGWQVYFKDHPENAWKPMRSYDIEIFRMVAVMTFGVACEKPVDGLFLTSRLVEGGDPSRNSAIYRRIVFPESWQTRVVEALQGP